MSPQTTYVGAVTASNAIGAAAPHRMHLKTKPSSTEAPAPSRTRARTQPARGATPPGVPYAQGAPHGQGSPHVATTATTPREGIQGGFGATHFEACSI